MKSETVDLASLVVEELAKHGLELVRTGEEANILRFTLPVYARVDLDVRRTPDEAKSDIARVVHEFKMAMHRITSAYVESKR